MSRIKVSFDRAKRAGKFGFIPYITSGLPNLRTTKDLILMMNDLDVTALELGVPFSDPLADGPVIQTASQTALDNGSTLEKSLDMIAQVRDRVGIPLVIMTYYNILLQYSIPRFVKDAASAGLDGIIVADLAPEEDRELMTQCRKNDIDTILIVSRTTAIDRMKKLTEQSRGFIYYTSHTGTTGVKTALPTDIKQNVLGIRDLTAKPVAVGFGVSRREHIRNLSRFADAAIVGSAIVRVISETKRTSCITENVRQFIRRIWI